MGTFVMAWGGGVCGNNQEMPFVFNGCCSMKKSISNEYTALHSLAERRQSVSQKGGKKDGGDNNGHSILAGSTLSVTTDSRFCAEVHTFHPDGGL